MLEMLPLLSWQVGPLTSPGRARGQTPTRQGVSVDLLALIRIEDIVYLGVQNGRKRTWIVSLICMILTALSLSLSLSLSLTHTHTHINK